MKHLLFLLAMLILTGCSFGQDKKDLAVSFSAGLLNSPYYKKASARGFYKFDFDYFLSRRHILSVNFLGGAHYYFDNVLSNDPNAIRHTSGTNAEARYRVFSVLYKYKVSDNDWLNIVSGVGVGAMTHEREYPYTEGTTGYPRVSTFTDIAFPVTLDVNCKISSHWQAGIMTGLFIEPDYPVLGYHIGPKLSYIIK